MFVRGVIRTDATTARFDGSYHRGSLDRQRRSDRHRAIVFGIGQAGAFKSMLLPERVDGREIRYHGSRLVRVSHHHRDCKRNGSVAAGWISLWLLV